ELNFNDEIDDYIIDEEEIKNSIPKSKRGEVYKLGNHVLMCGDSTDIKDVKKLVGNNKMDLLITDPPYNVNYSGKTKDKLTIQNDNLENNDFKNFLKKSFKAADLVMKKGAVFYIWHSD